METVQVKVIEPHISRQVQCPDCGIWHPFKKAKEHWRTVKGPSLTRPVLLRVRMVYSKCLNPRCPRRIFALPPPEPVPAFYGRGVTEAFCRRLDGWGIPPSCVIFDLLTTFPKFVARVWPQAYQQFDHFHVMQWLWHYLRNALIQFRKSLQGPRWALHREESFVIGSKS